MTDAATPSFDLIVIGAGPGGYVAAIRAAQLGLNTACIDKRPTLGGTCLNVGCIPSKALLHSSEKFSEAVDAKAGLASHGVLTGKVKLDLAAMMARKDETVATLTGGIEHLFKKNKVTRIEGAAQLTGKGAVAVTGPDGKMAKLTASHIIIATGSDSSDLPGLDIDERQILTSTGALSLAAVPDHLVVIGAGAIGLEMGSVWQRLGSKVTVIEFLDRILPGMDGELAKQAQRTLKRQGLGFQLGTKVTGATKNKSKVEITAEPVAGGDPETISCDAVLVAVGRRPFTQGLGLAEIGVATDERGFIEIGENFATSVARIYAIGDCVPGPMLAHKAEEEGIACVEAIAGGKPHVNYNVIPSIVYTHPEIACTGQTEEELTAAGIDYTSGKFPFMANSRARAIGETEGWVKILADAKTDRILGAHIIGADAGTLIHEAVITMEYGGSAEDLARTCHGHPTLNEGVKEAALAVDGRAIHM